MKIKAIPAILAIIITLMMMLMMLSCTKRTCPTYAVAPAPDTTAYKFSNAEKAGGVLFVLFAIYATQNSK